MSNSSAKRREKYRAASPACEAFQDRDAHAAVKQALLDVASGSAQCVVAYGMGGTGAQAV